MNKVFSFIKDVRLELGRVTWPTREETIKFTLVVIVLSAVLAAFLGGLDFAFTSMLDILLF